MTNHAAVLATFEDVKRIKTRKAWQLIFEVPEENYDAAVFALGGSPQSGEDRWVGIARVDEKLAVVVQETPPAPEVTETPQEPERVKGGARAKMAGILCNDPAFQDFLCAKWSGHWRVYDNGYGVLTTDVATNVVRRLCLNIESRAELDHNEEAGRIWDQIEADYRASQRGVTLAAREHQLHEGPG